MPGGKRNPLSMSHMLESLGDAVQSAKAKSEHHSSHLASVLGKVERHLPDFPPGTSFVDLTIQFIGASGLPKMDVVGTADPYFVAKLDNRVSFVSKVISNNLAPVWNEVWRIKNVPTTATLHVTVMDKDEGAVTDDYIGGFETSVAPGAKEAEITGPLFRRARGTLWLKIDSKPSADDTKIASRFPYLFDGPIRYSIHFSPTIGLLTNLDEARLYATWKMYLRGVPLFFRDTHQPWNRNYKAAQNIFQGPTSVAVRSGIQAGHRMLYARTATNGFGVIEKSTDVIDILHGGASSRPSAGGAKNAATGAVQNKYAKRVKPAVYTYIISSDDDSFRFSETGAAFFVDFASKHALHSNCCPTVRYSGEFHPRPQGGWQTFSDLKEDAEVEWELVIDNNSGTYAPDPMMLPAVKELLEYNFPGFGIWALDREDPRLKESVEACREYAMKFRGVGKDELQPTAGEGEVTLMHQASLKMGEQAQAGGSQQQEQDHDDGAGAVPAEQEQRQEQEEVQPQRPKPDGGLPRTSSDYFKDSVPETLESEAPPPDYSSLPPGCAPPAKFLPGQGYGAASMSRYDPGRR